MTLRRLGEQLAHEDPDLADKLAGTAEPRLGRLRFSRWPSSVYVAIGTAFLVAGLLLGVGSAVLAGIALLIGTALRPPARRSALTALLHRQDPRRSD
jgi:hypothetical protein